MVEILMSKATLRELGQWWRTPLVLALRRQRQKDHLEFEASLVFTASYRTDRST